MRVCKYVFAYMRERVCECAFVGKSVFAYMRARVCVRECVFDVMNSIPQRSDDACESSQAGDSLLHAWHRGS